MKNSKKALSPELLSLFQKSLIHSPRDLDSSLAIEWDNLPAEILEQKLREFYSQPLVDSSLLRYEFTYLVPLGREKFNARERLFSETGCGTNITIADRTPNFRQWFFGYEEPITVSAIRGYTLLDNAVDALIIKMLGGLVRVQSSLTEIEALMAKQPNGEPGVLLNKGRANVFFAPDADHIPREVIVSWHSGWQLSAYEIDNQVACDKDSRIFSGFQFDPKIGWKGQ